MEPRHQFGQNLRRERLRSGFSQERLAQECGLHSTEISRLERGVRDPRLSTICRVAVALGTTASELTTDCC